MQVLLHCFNVPRLRLEWLSKPVFKFFQKALPPMSETEQIALDAGDVWWEGELFRGAPNWQQLHVYLNPP